MLLIFVFCFFVLVKNDYTTLIIFHKLFPNDFAHLLKMSLLLFTSFKINISVDIITALQNECY